MQHWTRNQRMASTTCSTATQKPILLLTRIAISSIIFIVFALHFAGSPRFEVIDRMENYLYDVRVRATMPGGIDERVVIVDTLFDDYGIRTLGFDVLLDGACASN